MKSCILKGIFGAVILTAVLFGGCIGYTDPADGMEPKPVKVKIEIPLLGSQWANTRAGDPDGIDEVYMLIFDTGGSVVARQIFHNDPAGTVEIPGGDTTISVEHEIELLSQSIYDFFFAANVNDYYTELNAVDDIDDLTALQVMTIEGSNPYPEGVIVFEEDFNPFPRSSLVKGVWIFEDSSVEGRGKVSYDGNTLEDEFEVSVDRIASKINISIRKMTGPAYGTAEEDRFFITDLRLLRVPSYSFMQPATYTESEFNTLAWYKWVPDTDLPNNGREDNDYFQYNNNNNTGGDGITEYTPPGGSTEYYVDSNRRDVIIPEYVMADNTIEEEAVILEIRGDYEAWIPDGQGGGSYGAYEDVWVELPLSTGVNSGSPVFDFKRNNEYRFLITITGVANHQFEPDIKLIVSGWDFENDPGYNAGNADVSLSGSWTYGNGADANDIYVNSGDYVEYTFSFVRTGGNTSSVNWKAVLTDPIDFVLRTDGGASTGGSAAPGENIKVRVAPRSASATGHSTKLYINIDDGMGGTIKLPLDPTDRFVIHQNPQ